MRAPEGGATGHGNPRRPLPGRERRRKAGRRVFDRAAKMLGCVRRRPSILRQKTAPRRNTTLPSSVSMVNFSTESLALSHARSLVLGDRLRAGRARARAGREPCGLAGHGGATHRAIQPVGLCSASALLLTHLFGLACRLPMTSRICPRSSTRLWATGTRSRSARPRSAPPTTPRRPLACECLFSWEPGAFFRWRGDICDAPGWMAALRPR